MVMGGIRVNLQRLELVDFPVSVTRAERSAVASCRTWCGTNPIEDASVDWSVAPHPLHLGGAAGAAGGGGGGGDRVGHPPCSHVRCTFFAAKLELDVGCMAMGVATAPT
jgi:hypothetical protein